MGTAWAHPLRMQHVSARKSGARSHSEIAVFGHKYHSFSFTWMLASCPHETCDHAWTLTLDFHITFTWTPVNFTWVQAWGCLSVATPLLPPPPPSSTLESIMYKEDRKLNNLYQAKLIVTLSFLSVAILTVCTGVGGRGFNAVWLAKIQLHHLVCQKFFL